MRTVALYEMLFGIITLVLGVLGWAMASSSISFITGAASGIILVFGGLQLQKGRRSALYVCLIVTLAILGYFGWLMVTAPAVYPAGVMALLSLISLVLIALMLVQPAERKRIY